MRRWVSAWMSGSTRYPHTLQRFGLQQAPDQVPAMLLGAVDITPLEVAQLYNGLADGGFRTPLRAVHAVDQRRRQAAQGVPAAGDAGGAHG